MNELSTALPLKTQTRSLLLWVTARFEWARCNTHARTHARTQCGQEAKEKTANRTVQLKLQQTPLSFRNIKLAEIYICITDEEIVQY